MAIGQRESSNNKSLIKNFDLFIVIILILGTILTGFYVSNNNTLAQPHLEKKTIFDSSIYSNQLEQWAYVSEQTHNLIQFNLDKNDLSMDYIFVPEFFSGFNQASTTIFGFQQNAKTGSLDTYNNYTLQLPIHQAQFKNISLPDPYFIIEDSYSFEINQTAQGLLLIGRPLDYHNLGFALLYSFSIENGFHLLSNFIVFNEITNTRVIYDKNLKHDVLFYSTDNIGNSTLNIIPDLTDNKSINPISIEKSNDTAISTFNIISYSGINNFTYIESESALVDIFQRENNQTILINSFGVPYFYYNSKFEQFEKPVKTLNNDYVGITNDFSIYFFSYDLVNNNFTFIDRVSVSELRKNNLNQQTSNIISYQFFKSKNSDNLDFSVIGYNVYNDIFTTNFNYSKDINGYQIDSQNSKNYPNNYQLQSAEFLTYFSGSIFYALDDVFTNSVKLTEITFVPINQDLISSTKTFEIVFSFFTFLISFFTFIDLKNNEIETNDQNNIINYVFSKDSSKITFITTILAVGISLFFNILNINFPYGYVVKNLLLIVFILVLTILIKDYLKKKNILYAILIILNGIIIILFFSSLWFEFSIYLHINYNIVDNISSTTNSVFLVSGNLIFGSLYLLMYSLASVSFIIIFYKLQNKKSMNETKEEPVNYIAVLGVLTIVFVLITYEILIFAYYFLNSNDIHLMISIYTLVTLVQIIFYILSILIQYEFYVIFFQKERARLFPSKTNPSLNYIVIIGIVLIIYDIFGLKVLVPGIFLIISNQIIFTTILFLNLEVIFLLLIILIFLEFMSNKQVIVSGIKRLFSDWEIIGISFLFLLSISQYFIGLFIVFNTIFIIKNKHIDNSLFKAQIGNSIYL